MTALELFREFQDAQRAEGEFAYFTLVVFVPGIGCAQEISSMFPSEMQLGLLNASVDRRHQPLGIIGIPTLNALWSGLKPYLKRYVDDDWATGYLDNSIEKGIWLMKNNRH